MPVYCAVSGTCSVSGMSRPPWIENQLSSEERKRCSATICGVHTHKLPAQDNDGSPIVANEVGDSGAKKGASCPIRSEVFFQSKRIEPVRRRTIPAVEIGRAHV